MLSLPPFIRPLILAICLLVTTIPAFGQRAEPPGQAFAYKQVAAKEGRSRELKIYVTKPVDWQASDRRPAIVFFHGGGWVGGKPGQFTEHAKYFASRGLVCFQVEYRLLDRESEEPPIDCTQDAVDAMKWVRSHSSEFGIDPERIASAGGSAGGHLAAYVGCVEPPSLVEEGASSEASKSASVGPKANAMLLFNPVYDNGPGGWGTARVGDRYPEFSPAHNITRDDPPSIVFLGTEDKLIPVATAEKFRDQCLASGVLSELHTYADQPHGFFNFEKAGGRFYYETVTAADKFLNRLGWLAGAPTLQPPPYTATESSQP